MLPSNIYIKHELYYVKYEIEAKIKGIFTQFINILDSEQS